MGERQTGDLKVPGLIPGLGILPTSTLRKGFCVRKRNAIDPAAPAQEVNLMRCVPLLLKGTWCSGITSASHAEGPGFKSQCVHILSMRKLHCSFSILPCLPCVFFSSFLLFQSLFASHLSHSVSAHQISSTNIRFQRVKSRLLVGGQ